MAAVTITQRRSANGASRKQRDTLRTLGLGRIGRSAEREDSPALRGAVRVVEHLVEVKAGG
jgi:large subunit ribosomal protein L30